MARKRSPTRLGEILEAATRSFILKGYRETRVDEVAESAGISSATVYLYAATKEALFALVLARLFRTDLSSFPSPYVLSSRASLVNLSVDYLCAAQITPVLDAALASTSRARTGDFEAVVRELYHLVFQHRRVIMLVEKCGKDWPELEMLFRNELRAGLLKKLSRYLSSSPGLFQMPDPDIASRAIMELIAWFAMHRFSAADTSPLDDKKAEDTVITMIVRAFTVNHDEKNSSSGASRSRARNA